MRTEERLQELGITLPPAPSPVAVYIPAVLAGNTLYISGQGPLVDGRPALTGKVGGAVTLEQAREAARLCALNMLAIARDTLGTLDRVERIAALTIYVSSEVGFDRQHLVANGASELLGEIFGEAGRHSRTAIGVNQLPLDIPVEVTATIIVKE